jgi:hypothetical protein
LLDRKQLAQFQKLLLAAKAPKSKYGVQLDRVRRDPGLTVVEVEERDPRNASASAEPDVAPGNAHLAAPQRRRAPVAARRRRLRDHVITALPEDDVQVAVVLVADEYDPGRRP